MVSSSKAIVGFGTPCLLVWALSATAYAATTRVELIQHAAPVPFSFSVSKDNPSFSGVIDFTPFKYAKFGELLSTSIDLNALSSSWSYSYTPTANSGSFQLSTVTTVDASSIGGPPNYRSSDLEESISWTEDTDPKPGFTSRSGVDRENHFNQTFSPGGPGSSISYTYGWQQEGSGAVWNSLSETGSGVLKVDYRFTISSNLPSRTEFNRRFEFDVECVVGPCFYDPDVATGYTYEAIGTTFTSVMIPGEYGDGNFLLLPFNNATQAFDLPGINFASGDTVDLTHLNPGGVDKFRIEGIEPSAGVDPTDPTGFVTGLTFSANTGEFAMMAVVPEPEIYAMMFAGLSLLGWRLRQAKK